MADAVPQFVQPEGLALGIIVVSLIFLILSLISVGIRVYVRQDEETLGFDDWLMVGGTVRTFRSLDLSEGRENEGYRPN